MAAATAGLALTAPAALKAQPELGSSDFRGQSVSIAFPSTQRVPKKTPLATRASAAAENATDAPLSAHSHPNRRVINRRLILGGLAAGMAAVVGCPICDSKNPTSMGAALASEWTYGDLSGPNEWGDLCKTGTAQSPIDIPLTAPVLTKDNSLGSLTFAYKQADATFLNTGHGTMQVNFPAGSNILKVGDRQLDLLQYHFHAPSEHSFNGIRSAMEAHLVHRDQEGKLAVVGVMLEADRKVRRNLALEAALAFAPDDKGKQAPGPYECFEVPLVGDGEEGSPTKYLKQCLKIQISPLPLLPKPDREDEAHSYIHYKGSLTTPPCSEGVDWFVLSKPLKVADSQVLEFMRYVGDKQTFALNSRPRQDLGSRQLIIGPA